MLRLSLNCLKVARQRVNDSFRGSPLFRAQNVLVGDATAGAAFFNGEGGIMFKVFVGRDDKRELKADQVAAFNALAEKLGAA